jgi:hypothetical protein
MKEALIPAWIIGGPFIGLLILAFSFKGPSSMGGSGTRARVTENYGGTRDAPGASDSPSLRR